MRRRGFLGRAADTPAPAGALTPDAVALVERLPGEWLVLGRGARVHLASSGLEALGLLHNHEVASPHLAAMAEETIRDGHPRTDDLTVGGAEVGAPPGAVRVRTARIDQDVALLLIDDISAATRVDTMRRDFIANVSHELKTPVGALLLLADAADSAVDNPKALRKFTARMQLEASRLSALINDLTDLSRLQASDVTDDARLVSVKGIVSEAIDTVHLVAQDKRIDVVRDLSPGLKVYAREEQVVTALRNLLTNAIRYSPPHTKVTVTGRAVAGFLELAVHDEGIGIEPAQQLRIFERFHRVDPARSRETGGTGLGLAIVKHICLAHGGEVLVQSEVGRGSTFTLRLPLRRPGSDLEA